MQSRLPPWLIQAVDAELHGVSGRLLAKHYALLSAGYRRDGASKPLSDPSNYWLAYLAGRMPATFAAVKAALAQVPASLLQACDTLLDLGSGPGTAVWAAIDSLPGLKAAQALEQDATAFAMAQKLALAAPWKPQFQRAGLPAGLASVGGADLVILAYSAGEIGSAVLKEAFDKAGKLLVLVEPGTPAGFKIILEARKTLSGLVAPCPHSAACPLSGSIESKWCHFSARLERSKIAKLLKGGDLGYEDEKFCYAAFSKLGYPPSASQRILGRPKILERQIRIELCTTQGIEVQTVTKADKVRFKAARKAEWGEAWEGGRNQRPGVNDP